MRADDLGPLFGRSRLVRAAARAGERLRAAAGSSASAALAARTRRRIGALAPAVRLRLAGIIVLTALVTERILVRLIPGQLRPAPPIALYVWVAAIGATLLVAAPALVRAWPSSRIRRFTTLSPRARKL